MAHMQENPQNAGKDTRMPAPGDPEASTAPWPFARAYRHVGAFAAFRPPLASSYPYPRFAGFPAYAP